MPQHVLLPQLQGGPGRTWPATVLLQALAFARFDVGRHDPHLQCSKSEERIALHALQALLRLQQVPGLRKSALIHA